MDVGKGGGELRRWILLIGVRVDLSFGADLVREMVYQIGCAVFSVVHQNVLNWQLQAEVRHRMTSTSDATQMYVFTINYQF